MMNIWWEWWDIWGNWGIFEGLEGYLRELMDIWGNWWIFERIEGDLMEIKDDLRDICGSLWSYCHLTPAGRFQQGVQLKPSGPWKMLVRRTSQDCIQNFFYGRWFHKNRIICHSIFTFQKEKNRFPFTFNFQKFKKYFPELGNRTLHPITL